MLSLAACSRGLETKEAVRQAVIDHLAARQFNVPGMSVEVTSVRFNGAHADAVVSIVPKGGPAGSGMSMPYRLERQGGKWVVMGGSGNPHPGAGMQGSGMPGMSSPHGGAMPAPGDLPPVGKK
jgi:hypothetical protein